VGSSWRSIFISNFIICRKHVEMKKQSGKHILKGALTPNLARKQLRKESSNSLYKARSCSSLDGSDTASNSQANYLTVHVSGLTVCVFVLVVQFNRKFKWPRKLQAIKFYVMVREAQIH
jgi:hypothetical protein